MRRASFGGFVGLRFAVVNKVLGRSRCIKVERMSRRQSDLKRKPHTSLRIYFFLAVPPSPSPSLSLHPPPHVY